MPDVCIVSGADRLRLRSNINHKVYAAEAGMDYRFELGPFADLSSHYFIKPRTLLQTLPRYEWAVWLDDDAYVTDFERRTFHELIDRAERDDALLVCADGPRNAKGQWTAINAGVFLVKNTPVAFDLLRAIIDVSATEVASWWDPDRFGKQCGGDQDAMVWAIEKLSLWDLTHVVAHEQMNSRHWEYHERVDENFVCHFPGALDKRVEIHRFARRFGLDDTLVRPDLMARYGVPAVRPMRPMEMKTIEMRRTFWSKVPTRS